MIIEIVLWPDGTWDEMEDIDQYNHKSDDFILLTFPNTATYQEIEECVDSYLEKRK